MILALPKELIGHLDFSHSLPVLNADATEKQKIVYADFIKEWITEQDNQNTSDVDKFFKHH